MPRLGRHANPFELALQRLLPLAFGLFLAAQTLLFLFQPRRVVAFPRNALAAIELENPAGDVVEKIAIVRDGDDRARITLQVMLEPGDRLGIEMVGRLVEQKNVGLLQKQPAQGDAAPFAAGQNLHRRVRRRAAQRIHRHLQPRIEIPGVLMVELFLHFALALEQLVHFVVGHLFAKLGVDLFKLFQQIDSFLHGFFDDFAHGARVVDQRFLFEITDGDSPAR